MKISNYYTYAPKSKIKAGDANPNGKYQFYTSSPDESRRYDKYLYDCKAIIMGTGGSATLHYYDGKFSTSTDCLTLIPNEKIRAKYLYYFFLANMNVLEAGFKGAGLKHTSKGYIDNIEITKIPSLPSQDKIVNLFDELALRVEKERRQIEKLDELVKARFVEMFRRNNIDVISVGDAVELINGRAFKPTHWMADGLPIIRIQNLNDKTAPFNYFDGIYDKKNYVKKGELLFSWSGTPGTSFGAFIWDREPGILNQHIFRVLPKIDLELNYLRYALNDQLEIIISKAHGGVGLQHITKGELEKVLIPNPNIEQQHSFSNFVAQVDKSKFVLSNELTMCDFYIRLIHDRVMHSCINLRVAQ